VRREDLDRVIGALREPTRRFVHEARVRMCIVVNGAGQVLGQLGFTRSYEVVNIAALAAAAHAAAGALAQLTEAGRWTHLHNAGQRQQMFLAPVRTPVEDLILVAIFDEDTSLGLVQLFFDRLVAEVGGLPEFQRATAAGDAASFEGDLEAAARRVMSTDGPREA
jgi:predicted regulator of Ras-like GTPase activity (Roadblock/LC7/MglB family)